MSYLLVAILFLLLAAAFITFLVLRSTRQSRPASDPSQSAGERGDDRPPFAVDSAPLGDSDQHAGDQSRGETVTGTDADQAGGTGRPTGGVDGIEEKPPLEPHPPGRFQRDPVGGEAEARPYTDRD